MVTMRQVLEGSADDLNQPLRALLQDTPFVSRLVPQPLIFQYGAYAEGHDNVVYQFVFYEGAVVYAIAGQAGTASDPAA
jgi:hypothetical protein